MGIYPILTFMWLKYEIHYANIIFVIETQNEIKKLNLNI